MITEKTLFILGAGAHVPYGFPDAKGLRENILNNFTNKLTPLELGHILVDQNYTDIVRNNSINFIKAFRSSTINSIDKFISLRNEFIEIGKKAICLSILDFESIHKEDIKLYDKDEWFRYFFNKALEGIQSKNDIFKYIDNQFLFITFNYDRLIEKYFYENLSNSFGELNENLHNIINKYPIRHVYGKIGPLPDEPNMNSLINYTQLNYGETLTHQKLNNIFTNIKIMYDERISEKDWSDIISSYDRIFFLGFSYAEENMRVINLPSCLRRGQKVYGTAFGCTKNEIEKIREKFFSTSNHWCENSQTHLLIVNEDNLTLLRNYL